MHELVLGGTSWRVLNLTGFSNREPLKRCDASEYLQTRQWFGKLRKFHGGTVETTERHTKYPCGERWNEAMATEKSGRSADRIFQIWIARTGEEVSKHTNVEFHMLAFSHKPFASLPRITDPFSIYTDVRGKEEFLRPRLAPQPPSSSTSTHIATWLVAQRRPVADLKLK